MKKTKEQIAIEKIAEKWLHIETLAIRGSDTLDFHDLAVWQINAALAEAYNAGKESK